jgi:hypothetical protein
MSIRDKRTFITLILLLFSIIVFVFFILIPWFRADRHFVFLEYSGVINGIEYTDGNRGVPHVLLDDKWRLLTMGELKIEQHIAIGDSIVKKKGRQIEIFAKKNGKYQLKGVY